MAESYVMTNLTGVYSHDSALRRQFLNSAETRLGYYPGLEVRRYENGALALAWCAPDAFGVSIRCVGSQGRFDFGQVTETVLTTQESPAGSGGFHVSLIFSDREIRIGSDAFGLFPFYYCQTKSIFSFATAPYLLKDAPGFSRDVEPVSLAMLLMLGVIPGSRTLLKGLHRVAPFKEVRWTPGEDAHETTVRPLQATDRFFADTFENNLERIDASLIQAVDAGLGSFTDAAFLLSGGLDARLLAGYVARRKDVRIQALTQGRSADVEVYCARKVADELRWAHQIFEEDETTIETLANLKIDHEFMSGGFGLTYFSQMAIPIREKAALSGAYGDGVLGCAEFGSGWRDRFDADSHLKRCFHPYFAPEFLRRMPQARSFKQAVSCAEEEIQSLFQSFSGLPFQKAWQFDFLVIDRLKVTFPRYLAFGGSPVIPFADRSFVEAIAGTRPQFLAARKMERELLLRRFPMLAALPVDRNRRAPVPALTVRDCFAKKGIRSESRITALKSHMSLRAMAFFRQLNDRMKGSESRFYYRILDVNRPPWKRLRARAQKGRRFLEDWISEDALGRWFPDPESRIDAPDAIYHAQRTRLLTGIALWADRVLRG